MQTRTGCLCFMCAWLFCDTTIEREREKKNSWKQEGAKMSITRAHAHTGRTESGERTACPLCVFV